VPPFSNYIFPVISIRRQSDFSALSGQAMFWQAVLYASGVLAGSQTRLNSTVETIAKTINLEREGFWLG